tara:strand:+ start:89148 stop:89987 length:840 start_codon:yes stop_codon:yes gene_type:complete
MSANPEVIYNRILEAIASNKLPLPSKPDIVSALQEVATNPDIEVNDLFEIISQDPALTARLLRLANSPLVRGKVAVNNLETAISRMGVHFVSNLATGLALEQLFKTDNPLIAKRMEEAWQMSTQVAAVCSVITAHLSKLPSDQAMLGGLLHEIGTLSILSYAEKNLELLEDPELLDQLIANHTTKLSEDIMTAWQFPAALSNLPKALNQYYENKDKPDLADTLLIAKIDVIRNNPNHPLNELNKEELPCYNRLNLDPGKTLDEYPELANDLAAAKEIFK